MSKKKVYGIILTLVMFSMLALASNVQPVKAIQTIYILADGSISPPSAPIQRNGNLYTLTGNITISDIYSEGIVVQKDNIIIDGAGYTLEGPYSYSGYGQGLNLTNVGNVTIKKVNIKGFDDGIWFRSSPQCHVFKNNISNNGYGIRGAYNLNITISENSITNNVLGMSLSESSNIVISGNNVSAQSNYGIRLVYYLSSSITGNSITNNANGLVIIESSNITICGNDIRVNTLFDTFFGFVSNSSIYHNNFVNSAHVSIIDSVNVWDNGYPSGGNYWSNYSGVDLYRGSGQNETGCDGIGDTPYAIDEDNQDNYPLMKPYGTWLLGDSDFDSDIDEDDLWYFCEAFIDYYEIHVKDSLCDFDNDCDIDEDDLWTMCEAFIDYWKHH